MDDGSTTGKAKEQGRPAERVAGSTLQRREAGTAEPFALASDRGRTTVADSVVAKISGIAAREVHGVHDMGAGATRALGAVRQRIPGAKRNVAQGVNVEVGEKQCAVDLDLVVEYGVEIAHLANEVRENVIESLERMTGLEVVEVNIAVDDVHIDHDDNASARQLQ